MTNLCGREVGPFGSIYDISAYLEQYRHAYMLTSVDGPGTVPMIAKLANDLTGDLKYFDIIGRNVAKHCASDIGTAGARPKVALDNISSDDMNPDIHEAIVKGLVKFCLKSGCCLTGGECAQLHGVIVPGEYDFCAFTIGFVEEEDCINPLKRVRPGNALVGIASQGIYISTAIRSGETSFLTRPRASV